MSAPRAAGSLPFPGRGSPPWLCARPALWSCGLTAPGRLEGLEAVSLSTNADAVISIHPAAPLPSPLCLCVKVSLIKASVCPWQPRTPWPQRPQRPLRVGLSPAALE